MSSTETSLLRFRALVQARYNFTLTEKRVAYIITNEVRAQFVERRREIPEGDLSMRVEINTMAKVNLKTIEVIKALKSLSKKDVHIVDGDTDLDVCFVSRFKHLPRSPFFDIVIPRRLVPYIVAFATHFNIYQIAIALTLKTKYCQRFYEYCSLYDGKNNAPQNNDPACFYITVEALRQNMKLEDMYAKYGLLRTNVLKPAQKELNERYQAQQCNLYFEYREEKSEQNIEGVLCHVYSRYMHEVKFDKLALIDRAAIIRCWLDEWLTTDANPEDRELVDMVMTRIDEQNDLIVELHRQLARLKERKIPAKDCAYIAKTIIKEEIL